MTPPQLRIVPHQAEDRSQTELDAVIDRARDAITAAIAALDDLVGVDALNGRDGDTLMGLYDRCKDLTAALDTALSTLGSRINQWIWSHGTRRGVGGPVAQLAGRWFQARLTGTSSSLKVPEQVALGHAIFERATNEAIRLAGMDPADNNDPHVVQLRLFGSILDGLIVGRNQTPPAARLVPMKKTLAAGLVDTETGEITPTPDGQIRWALNVANYETPTAGVRARTFTAVEAPEENS